MSCGNIRAPKGQIWVCTACGKKARDKYGFDPIDHGYDVSCMINSVLCYEDKLRLKDSGRVAEVLKGGVVEPQP